MNSLESAVERKDTRVHVIIFVGDHMGQSPAKLQKLYEQCDIFSQETLLNIPDAVTGLNNLSQGSLLLKYFPHKILRKLLNMQ